MKKDIKKIYRSKHHLFLFYLINFSFSDCALDTAFDCAFHALLVLTAAFDAL